MKSRSLGVLVVKSGPDKGREIDIHSGHSIKLGRGTDNDLVIPDHVVSRKHAEINADENTVFFNNYGANGSVVNGVTVRDSKPMPLTQKATNIVIGPCLYTFNLSSTQLMEDNYEVSKTNISRPLDQGEESGSSVEQQDGVSGETESPSKKGDSQLLKSPVAKAIVIILIIIGALYLFLPSSEESLQIPATSNEEAQREQEAISVNLPEVSTQGAVPVSDEQAALSLFKAAVKLFSEQRLRDRNIYDSIQKWQQSIDIIGKYSERPVEFDEAVEHIRSAKKILHDKYKNIRRSIRIANEQQNYQRVLEGAQRILASIPDQKDWRYRWAKAVESDARLKLNDQTR